MRVVRFVTGTYLDPGDHYSVARKPLARRFPEAAHDHDFYELFLVVAGRTQHWINGRSEVLQPGHLVFVRPPDAHAFCADRRLGCTIVNVIYRPETAAFLRDRYPDEFTSRLFDAPGPMPETHMLDPRSHRRAVALAGGLQVARRTRARIEEFLLTLANRLADPGVPAPAEGPAWFVEACRAVRHPSLFVRGAEGLVAAAGRSHEHVCRTCKQVLGMTPGAYVNRVRMEHAAALLGSSDDPIAEIALAVGTPNVAHFYRLFKEAYGTTPRAFRQRHGVDPFAA